MPSQLHEFLLMLFSTPSVLLLQSLRGSPRVNMPSYSEARTDSADLIDIQPAEYRADHVSTLVDEKGFPVLGIIVEVQLARADRKRCAHARNWGRTKPSYMQMLCMPR
jgi:hypothetical protein